MCSTVSWRLKIRQRNNRSQGCVVAPTMECTSSLMIVDAAHKGIRTVRAVRLLAAPHPELHTCDIDVHEHAQLCRYQRNWPILILIDAFCHFRQYPRCIVCVTVSAITRLPGIRRGMKCHHPSLLQRQLLGQSFSAGLRFARE